jgi:hypothetical protein
MLKEWIVTLYNHEDLESFYKDMETPGGSLYIPDRAVILAKRRPMSRNTHYMLTFEEAELLRQDERVWGVELLELLEISTRPLGYKITSGSFAKDWGADANDINWGLLRQSESIRPSLIDTTAWVVDAVGQTGSVVYYNQNGDTAENARVSATDPWGNTSVVWETRASGNNEADGGWNTSYLAIDRTKLYRFSVWVRRTSSTSGGTFYLGTNSDGGVFSTSDGSQKSNPYWECSSTSILTQNQWYLVCGFIYPSNTTHTGNHPDSGYYTPGSTTKVRNISYCNIVSDLKWGPTSTTGQHRCYHYYCNDNTTRLQFAEPRIDLCDGSEPSIYQLVNNTANRTHWGDNSTSNISSDLTITASGRNVDVVIFDGHVDPSHPEFAVNSNGTGGSRIVQYNWFQNNVGFGTGTYVYTPYVDPNSSNRTSQNDHGVHVAGTAAGNTQGWARDANIYNISIYSSNQNFGTLGLDSTTYWDYVRAWHNNKPINTNTGRRNPTISNHSYGSSIVWNTGSFGPVTRVVYRGVDFNPGRSLTVEELQARGFYTTGTTPEVPFYSTSRDADIQDAINDGIIVIAAAGNEYWKVVNNIDQDYNNTFYATVSGSNFVLYLNRGTGSAGQGYAPVITVGAVGSNSAEYKATFSNCGNQVDIFAAGRQIQSSLHTASGSVSSSVLDPRNSNYFLGKYQGTSMATPQVTGMIACLAEHWPNIKQQEASQWLIDFSNKEQMGDTGEDSAMQTLSLQGAPNRFARWFNQRPVEGGIFPQTNFRPRTVDEGFVYYGKRLWPRPRIRRRG